MFWSVASMSFQCGIAALRWSEGSASAKGRDVATESVFLVTELLVASLHHFLYRYALAAADLQTSYLAHPDEDEAPTLLSEVEALSACWKVFKIVWCNRCLKRGPRAHSLFGCTTGLGWGTRSLSEPREKKMKNCDITDRQMTDFFPKKST